MSITQDKIESIARLANCPLDEATKIIDPTYTYWSERGDSTKEEHFAFLENSSAEEIAGWVQQIWQDIKTSDR